jgi:hypothetical protein
MRKQRPWTLPLATSKTVISATLRKPKTARWPTTARLPWQKYGLQPHRVESFKFSRDPQFDRELAEVVGLYLDPPERAPVLCVDESQIQALDRTQPPAPWPR